LRQPRADDAERELLLAAPVQCADERGEFGLSDVLELVDEDE
jgi:hypothetical protein